MSPLLLLSLLLIAAANAKTTPPSVAAEAGGGPSAPPVPATPWPEQFHSVVITNQTARGDRLQQIDIYYDRPRGRGLNIIRDQLDSGGEPLRDVQWATGTSFLFDSAASCRVFQYPVGLLPPDLKARGGAAYLVGLHQVAGTALLLKWQKCRRRRCFSLSSGRRGSSGSPAAAASFDNR